MADREQRWDLSEAYDHREFSFAAMIESPNGLYVLHSEYSKLETELRDTKRRANIAIGCLEVKEQLNETLRGESIKNKSLHADIIDQGRKVQIAASGESKYGAMSAGEYIEWVAKMLEDGR